MELEEPHTLLVVEPRVEDTNVVPCDVILEDLTRIKEEVQNSKDYISGLTTQVPNYAKISIGDENFFKIIRGSRVTEQQCKEHPGDIPVVASGTYENSYLGTISESYLAEIGLSVFENSDKILTVGSTGAVGKVHMRREAKWYLHDDALAVEVLDSSLYPEYIRHELQHSIDIARFDYTAKLYSERLKGLSVKIPLNQNDEFDRGLQETIANAYNKKEETEFALRRFALHLQSINIEF